MTGSHPARPTPWLAAALDATAAEHRRILLIDPRHPQPMALRGLKGADITFATLAAVDAGLLDRTTPDVVLAPLMTPSFDVLDLARRLRALGYRGQLRAFTPNIPDPHLVRSEIASACPGLDFDLIVLATD
ncbi:hypothetical protein [Phaeovulum sp.]|uniref:hypothetical protein n=1 Tax=Phaeovulum sp. TaxID=2934796 RepID=UPI0027318BEF|nr:hypothetical protein [Phaeovulum sp.]MDP1667728.1 hypothetical protein [Phaeovulum sp.]MDP2062892.1 hypothetical protein [Phaeovulum sp.]MDP3861861.1 hypothetical protein [Phaeovulum sp.]MDZ4118381.1 hypothetical protein [Phaeovulum sp.]